MRAAYDHDGHLRYTQTHPTANRDRLPESMFPMFRTASVHIALATVLALTACASANKPVTDQSTAEELYRSAKQSLGQNDFLTAIDTFETLGARYPFGSYTQQAQLDVAYAYYKQDEFDNAISAADRFIKLYPRSESVDYAYYLKGLSHYERGSSFTETFFPRDMARVDQNWLRAAYTEFDSLIRRFPDSQYVPDARARMEYLRDEMARHELITARYYYQRGAMVAAVNRVTYLLEHYDGSRHIPNALALMASAYGALGQSDLEGDTLRVLENTAPEHPALAND